MQDELQSMSLASQRQPSAPKVNTIRIAKPVPSRKQAFSASAPREI